MGKKILEEQQPQNRHEIVNSAITNSTWETALHVAAGANQTEFVQMLINHPDIDLTFQDINGNTAFSSAIAGGAIKIVKKFLTLHLNNINNYFVTTRDEKGMSPLYIASWFGQPQIASLLYQHTIINNVDLENGEQFGIFFNCIHNDIYDLALKMIESRGHIVHQLDTNGETALHILSRKRPMEFKFNPQAIGTWNRVWSKISFQSARRRRDEMPALRLAKEIWKRILEGHEYEYFEIRSIIRNPFNLVIEAAKNGNFDLLVVLFSMCPELIWEKDDENNTIFHIAILNRHVKIFKLIHEINVLKSVVRIQEDETTNNNILHLVAKKPQQSRLDSMLGVALQMRHELLWYQEVEKILAPSLRNKRNIFHQTPKDIFIEEHTEMMNDTEKWMKKNSNTCLIVATIILTVTFPTAFDILDQGSYNSIKHTKGIITNSSDHHTMISMTLLTITNAIAMSFSSTAILLFLSIMISRFTEKELVRRLPWTFVVGLSLLFISVTSMMLSFCFSSFLHNASLRLPIIYSSLQLLPIALFFYLIFPVLRDTLHSTFFFQNDFKSTNHVLQHYQR
ncbi:uncharacterized protein LOC115724008 [Cannabis sativa]|uniref:uncharacterized protein LOC115724008 n=1 Tax=Cannabis sativa TaxID=3483 RepID=UPI0029C9E624|nr:uncharacterized protein LOC115724008 [Cannabis sativa]